MPEYKRLEKPRLNSFGISRKIFGAFFAISIFALLYLNLTSEAALKLVSEEFPEWAPSTQSAVIRSYKMGVSLFLFFIDVILVGPFAWLSYFGEHIKPKEGKPVNYLSFFDIGMLLALWFTLALSAAHFSITNSVAKHPVNFLSPETLGIIIGLLFLTWVVILMLKVHSYTREQRAELKKYLMRL